MSPMHQIDWNSIRNFSQAEFNDNRGECWIAQDLVFKLDTARELAGVAFKINSACRNPEQNERAGGSQTSSHLTGLAVDISCTDSVTRHAMVSALLLAGFNRIGIASDFIHADIDTTKTQDVIWVY